MNQELNVFVTRNKTKEEEGMEWSFRPDEQNRIHEALLDATNGEEELSKELLEWSKTAKLGEERKFKGGKIEVNNMMLLF